MAKQDLYANRPADVSFVIDSLLALSEASDSFFHQTIDGERIGVTGHSFGADTTLMASARDPRVDAGLPLASGAIVPAEEIARIRVPMMIPGGSRDTLNPIEEWGEHDYAALNPPRYLVAIFNMGHFGFSNECIRPIDPCDDPTTLT
ncbi:dienelactone hydrolase family protein [Candidatus Binatia bacterium]|nr:dienelactone hydrolase family protein [Candidatus Binatia bacterium]